MKSFRPTAAARARLPLLLALPIALSACSVTDSINERTKIDYQSARKLEPLDVPPDLVSPQGDERFTIPERGQRTFSGYESARAAARTDSRTEVLPTVAGMKVERIGTQRWLVVNQSPDKLWPQVREFWQESGFVLASESPATGVMETEWAENRAKIPQDIIRRTLGRLVESVYSTAERDKFRTRFEVTPAGTEIFISHRGMEEVYTTADRDRTVWQPRDADPELEAEFLRRLMVRLGAEQERAAEMLASSVETRVATSDAGSGQIAAGGTADVLEIREGFERAWRRVGLALDRGGFTVEDRDRSQGLYFVRYIDPEVEGADRKPGLLSRMFSGGPKKATSAQEYRIHVEGNDEASRVVVLSKDGKPLTSDNDRQTGTKIIALLRQQLQP